MRLLSHAYCTKYMYVTMETSVLSSRSIHAFSLLFYHKTPSTAKHIANLEACSKYGSNTLLRHDLDNGTAYNPISAQ